MTYLLTHWKAIIIALALLCSNYMTYQYVDNTWQLKWSEASVDTLKSTLDAQKKEMVKQKQIVDSLAEVNKDAEERNIQINSDLVDANESLGLLKQRLNSISKGGKGAYTGTVDRSSAANATTELIYGQLLERCATRVIGLSEVADRHRAAGLSCESQYKKIKEVINGE